MSGETLKFTPEQNAAINYRGSALLVSAAAGSGKTRVLVERLLSYIDGGGADIGDFLVITYTRAAAAELRERVFDEIAERLTHNPSNRRLRRQSLLVSGANIDTIHGFCAGVLRENAHLADLTPDFRVADTSESELIRHEVLTSVLNEAYETIDESPGFAALVDTMSAGRDDSRLARIILDAHARLQSNPDPAVWTERQAEALALDGVSDASDTAWGELLMTRTHKTALFWLGEIQNTLEEIETLPDLKAAYGASVAATCEGIRAFIAALGAGWDAARTASAIPFPRVKGISGYEDIKSLRLRCKNAMEKLAAVFECSSCELLGDMQAVKPAVTELLRLIPVFDRAYAEEKRRRGLCDFSDLEHLTLKLLTDSATGMKTELAQAISGRFREIMVDEYQDCNAVQELIFSAVSREGTNVFTVGDVKQSIYRFRLADPSIFLEKYRRFPLIVEPFMQSSEPALGSGDFDTGTSGVKILLSKNFRSRSGVLDAVNFVFEKIMSREFGEMDYTEYLIPGRADAYSHSTEPAVELNITDLSGVGDNNDDDAEAPAKTQIEAQFIAERISELAGTGVIPDGAGGVRRIEYSDIVILLRTVRSKAWRYAEALAERGIPVEQPSGEAFFETFEIMTALSLLAVIDNPMQDIPLTAALRSPVYNFSVDELAEIRIQSPDTDFFTAVVRSAEKDSKCAAFLRELEDLQALAPDMPADRFIWHVYNKTRLLALMGAGSGGVRRRENLISLADYARKFEVGGYKGLFGFLTHLRALKERGEDLTPDFGTSAQNAVRIMSIHKAKGLEFPVVILADTSKRLNNADANAALLFHPQLGFGAKRVDRARRIEYPTLARLAVQKKLTSEMMAEELRVLYVAMTRAREKLIITATFTDAAREIERLSKSVTGGKIPPAVLEDVRSMSGWLLLSALTRPESGFLRNLSEEPMSCSIERNTGDFPYLIQSIAPNPQSEDHFGDGRWDVRLVRPGADVGTTRQNAPAQEDFTARETVAAAPEAVAALRERFAFVYPFGNAPELPSKLTVTGIKGRDKDLEAAEESDAAFAPAPTRSASGGGATPQLAFDRPAFVTQKTALTATERGSALHLAMQFLDYTRCGDICAVRAELARLTEQKLIAKEQADAVDAAKIANFFESDTGRRLLRSATIQREFKFSLLCEAREFFPDGGGDSILLQGVIDCWFEEDGELVVVDFKTDYVTPDTLGEKARTYSPQLTAYSNALERITGMRVKSRVIYFFALNRAVEV